MREKYQSEASVIKPAILAVLIEEFGDAAPIEDLTHKLVDAVLKAQRKHNHEVIGEE